MVPYSFPVIAYLIGSISSAIVLAKIMGLKDPREVGSGNPGATNILRYGGKKLAAITLLGDILKGVIPVVLARMFTQDALILSLVAAGAFLGHLYPVYFKFRGGKGVATAFGVIVATVPWVGLALAVTWLVTVVAFRYVSLSSIITAITAPVYIWFLLPDRSYFVMSILVAALLSWRHRTNIKRLWASEESKIGK